MLLCAVGNHVIPSVQSILWHWFEGNNRLDAWLHKWTLQFPTLNYLCTQLKIHTHTASIERDNSFFAPPTADWCPSELRPTYWFFGVMRGYVCMKDMNLLWPSRVLVATETSPAAVFEEILLWALVVLVLSWRHGLDCKLQCSVERWRYFVALLITSKCHLAMYMPMGSYYSIDLQVLLLVMHQELCF